MRTLQPKKAYLDSLAGSIVRSRGYCQNPDCHRSISDWNPLCWCHIIPRKYLALRWLPENALCLCLECEKYFTVHPIEQRELFISVIGEEAFLELKQRSHKVEYIDYSKLKLDLNLMIKSLKSEGKFILSSY